MWDLSSQTRDWTRAHEVEVQSLNLWMVREVPEYFMKVFYEQKNTTTDMIYYDYCFK